MDKSSRVLVTGASGFLGGYVVEELKRRGYVYISMPTHKEYDLTSRYAVKMMYAQYYPDAVINLAASLGGIEAHVINPGKFFYENMCIGTEVIHQAMLHKVKKFVNIGTSCSYPAIAPDRPMRESDLWAGYPNAATAPYGVAKLALTTMAQAYHHQYGLNAVTVIPANIYGPRDVFDPKRSHVIPALIKKCLEDKELVVWGSGVATREFIYAEDCARGIVSAMEQYDDDMPVNLGTGYETSMKELVDVICKCTKFKGKVVWDTTKPEGQLRRVFDVSRAFYDFGFRAETPLTEGIEKTTAWYLGELSESARINK